jgi:hypothetical protein
MATRERTFRVAGSEPQIFPCAVHRDLGNEPPADLGRRLSVRILFRIRSVEVIVLTHES